MKEIDYLALNEYYFTMSYLHKKDLKIDISSYRSIMATINYWLDILETTHPAHNFDYTLTIKRFGRLKKFMKEEVTVWA